MREGIGSTFLYNIIIVFIVIAFAFLAGTMSYAKAFKVNSRIINAIEKYEGYNELAALEIDQVLNSIGYRTGSTKCPRKDNKDPEENLTGNFQYCIYYFPTDGSAKRYSYGVTSYMYIDLPIIRDAVKVPIYSKTDRLYLFSF